MNDFSEKQTLLVVDDTPENIAVLKGILCDTYSVRAATSGALALKIIEKQKPNLILLDVMMPDMDGYDVCRRLKSSTKTSHIPVIFVSAKHETIDEQRGFDVGAVDYISKPVNPVLVKARVRTHLTLADQHRAARQLVKTRTRELEASQRAAVFMLGEAGHYNDTDTGVHIWRMAAYAGALARALHWPVERADLLELAASMHDTGKIGIPDGILKAPRKLTVSEWETMKTHTTIGHRILSRIETELFKLAAEVALSHHERWDGSGYPEGRSGEDIPESARIVAIADVFDALTMQRPYKDAWSVETAFETLKRDAGTHFDPGMVELFVSRTEEIVRIKEDWGLRESESESGDRPATIVWMG
ncbi:MAG: response regulator [Gammaproteobacteria bacterium]|nr:response regulator [Gammaproteobacteria bacterium]